MTAKVSVLLLLSLTRSKIPYIIPHAVNQYCSQSTTNIVNSLTHRRTSTYHLVEPGDPQNLLHQNQRHEHKPLLLIYLSAEKAVRSTTTIFSNQNSNLYCLKDIRVIESKRYNTGSVICMQLQPTLKISFKNKS